MQKNKVSKKRILMTGGTGFIGANLTRHLLNAGYSPHLIIRNDSHLENVKDVLDKIHIYRIKIRNKSTLKRLAEKISPDYICHLGSYGNTFYQQDAREMIETNILGLYDLLEATQHIRYKLFINAGSSSEYGFKHHPMKETEVLEPMSFYAATKASATLIARVFALSHNKPLLSFRFFSAYGPFENEKRFIPTVINNILHEKPVTLTKKISRHDFTYVEDVCRAYTLAFSIRKKTAFRGEVINLGTGMHYTNEEVVTLLSRLMKKRVMVKKGLYKSHAWDTDYWKADFAKAKRVLSWRPNYSLTSGLEKTIAWYTSQK